MNKRRMLAVVPVLGLVAGLAAVAPSGASSHREAPLTGTDPTIDHTDVYAFRTPDAPGTVTLVANVIPFQDPAGGPNFYRFGDDVLYRINIDNDADALPDVGYDFRFVTQVQNPDTFLYGTGPITSNTDADYNVRQQYSVQKLDFDRKTKTTIGSFLNTPPVNVGPRTTPNYAALAAAAVGTLSDGSKVFAGQRDDPFWVDLGSIFDLGGLRPFNQAHAVKLPTEAGQDSVAGYNVHTIAIQVPITEVTKDRRPATVDAQGNGNGIIGVWATNYRRVATIRSADGGQSGSGGYRQVSRLGMPLVNEVVVPLRFKNNFNASEPKDDGRFLPAVQDPELARLIPQLYPGVEVPPAPRNDIVAIFLTGLPGLNKPANGTPSEMLRLNLTVEPKAFGQENPLGVIGGDNAGFPNGRRLGDDVVDIELRALAGATPFTPAFNKAPNNQLGDGVNVNDVPLLTTFPYVPLPTGGYESRKGRTGETYTTGNSPAPSPSGSGSPSPSASSTP